MERRNFLKNSMLATGSILSTSWIGCNPEDDLAQPVGSEPISQQKNRLAIAMWDFSWILRHHRYGEFENWDSVLEALASRGYNAIRIDAMPQFIASDQSGNIIHEYRCVKKDWTPPLWGNQYTTTIQPRDALLEFLPLCRKYGIRVGLATWFSNHNSGRQDIFNEENGLLRAWNETLTFLEQHALLDDILYVDLLNEYPFWHGYDWLKKSLDERSNLKQFQVNNPEAYIPEESSKEGDRFNPLQKKFYQDFTRSMISELKKKFPKLDFYFSLDSGMALEDMDYTGFAAIDYHIWFAHHGSIPGLDEISRRDQRLDLKRIYKDLLDYWDENSIGLIEWMDSRLQAISQTAAKHNIPCGNTEGWGPISWFDHPEVDWQWVKTAAEICIDLALKHDNYKFLCTSNFTHPQFRGIWEHISWHRAITDKIKEN